MNCATRLLLGAICLFYVPAFADDHITEDFDEDAYNEALDLIENAQEDIDSSAEQLDLDIRSYFTAVSPNMNNMTEAEKAAYLLAVEHSGADPEGPDFDIEFQRAMSKYLQLNGSPCEIWDNCDFLGFGNVSYFRQNSLARHSATMELGGGDKEDEKAFRADWSIKYTFISTRCSFTQWMYKKDSPEYFNCLKKYNSNHNWHADVFFGMTGQFDFYFPEDTGRYSAPVVNRVSNPGLYIQAVNPSDLFGSPISQKVTFGAEHRSDGQVFEQEITKLNQEIPENIAAVQAAYNSNDHQFLDSLSQGANYLSMKYEIDNIPVLKVKDKTSEGDQKRVAMAVGFYTQGKWIFDDNGRQYWNEPDFHQVGFKGYDIFDVGVRMKFPDANAVLDANYNWGSKAGNWDVSLTTNWLLPLYFKYHNGPMEYLAFYSVPTTSWTVGFNFTPEDLVGLPLGKVGKFIK